MVTCAFAVSVRSTGGASGCAGHSQKNVPHFAKQAVTETFLSTANIRIAYAQNSLKTAKYLSEEMGFRTITTKSRSRHVNDPWQGHISESQTRRELMLPHEIRELDRRRELLLVEAAPPIKADKIRYYADGAFTKLLRSTAARPKLHNAIVEPPQMPATGPALTNEEIDEVLGAVRAVPTSGRTE